jgi:hypothetical protein
MSVSDPWEKIKWGADSEPLINERVPSSAGSYSGEEVVKGVRDFKVVSGRGTIYRYFRDGGVIGIEIGSLFERESLVFLDSNSSGVKKLPAILDFFALKVSRGK